MKQTLLALALLAALSANATNYSPLTGAISNSSSASNATGVGGTGVVNVDSEKPAASSAIAPSTSSFVKCPIATQESKAISVLIFSASGTTGLKYSGLCYAIERGDWETATKMMCEADKNYAKANPKCEVK
jgi:hypothetical protein